ncbi:MAG: D-glycero-beta-D-manno-heptose-7-phosphate kinase [Desulfovibrio sp.]|jgi:rfaE bifunctional protein kinase chain/domain|nr:D-glycero-beta-D-manno-heptose-7-phosphate kinase [Desulfovibrio sp.]
MNSAPNKSAAKDCQGQHYPVAREDLQTDMASFFRARVLVIGDLMLDRYLTGDATRISPEAPIPVVLVEKEDLRIGGAGNVALNIKSLGGEVVLIGRRGADAEGQALEQCLLDLDIQSSLLVQKTCHTPLKTRIIARGQQMLRVDREKREQLGAMDCREILRKVKEQAQNCGAIVISDYDKGLIGPELMEGLRKICAGQKKTIPLLVDPKPANFHLYKGVTTLTPNLSESSACVNMPAAGPKEITMVGRAIMEKCACPHLVITLGAQGMAVFASKDDIRHIPTVARQVFDVTGAGDSVIATLAIGAATGLSLLHSCLLANYAAGLVVGKSGAAAITQAEIREALAALPIPESEIWSQS